MLDQFRQQDWKALILRSDVMVAVGLVAILMVMILPLPSFMLDIFLSLNITIALLILIICLYTMKALEFALFPSVLLATTLFRLSLNVASTRLILLRGNEGPAAAGSVIQSFGQFVVGGNYVVGVVVFIILVVINFMVITKGAGRVAEVAARFTLDAMPGKQMAIDADLNAGLLTEAEARDRRKEIASEATFYGAMDGASKFVKGDAIAGIIITLINIGAGFIIGVVQKGMAPGAAAETYTILTVGDGLVGQIPALIISTAAGILVTRTAGEQDFGGALKSQFTIHPQALWVVSGILLAFALIPGLPTIPFLVLSTALAFAAYNVQKAKADQDMVRQQEERQPQAPEEENYEDMLSVDLLELEVGYGLIPMVDANQNGELLPRIRSIRKQFALDFGFIIPPIHIKDNLQLKPNEYAVLLKGMRIASGEILPNHHLAMNPGIATEPLKGVATTEPAFGLPATWIGEDLKERAQIAGYTVVDGTTVITTHITEIIKKHAHELIGRQEVQNLLDNLGKSFPKLVEELTPNLLPLGSIMKVLQNLLREQVSIRDLRTILETLADWGGATKDPDLLTEQVRQAMARAISGRHAQDDELLELMTLDHQLEETIEQAVHRTNEGSYLALDPGTAQTFLENLANAMQSLNGGATPILLCTPTIRPHVKRLTERYLPNLVCLSHNEISPHLRVQSVGTVTAHAG
ncbi:flagellar biogenesis protein FlhA [Syntrophotalea carbinolica DSM 2380]|uniref:Flagellar biosynthesis protein FlhA n=1 Tax=Syntrophotalea carbinolica (strain DSM 2380 / NBRC 103641 / GraBd1) TaxID=338963 RepID=Q3A5E6_SYNC1|nr:flagellar biosynthesis protein FlhA [Syntrophotalea carbinolica]ABA88411.1 flagellar biogenesis protein FlhA [Syntrophotalea carbinolica DSM 2380]